MATPKLGVRLLALANHPSGVVVEVA